MEKFKIEKFIEKYNLKLTKQQTAAVANIGMPTLLLAVPGSGKTTTLVSRIGYMIFGCEIKPKNILTITYTVAASHDMKERFKNMFGDADVKFQTINALCQGIIYRYNQMTGGSGFSLIENSGELLKEVYLNVIHEYPTDSDLRNMQQLMTYIKNMMLTSNEIENLRFEDYPVKEIYDTYENMLRERRLMDFDDQMVYAYRILRKYPQLLKSYQQRYPYICVDEAQDTSKIQHEIIALLAGNGRGLFMVGDEDQSIYGFRAAYPQALMEFEKKYQGAHVLFLEENFRSTPQIVNFANDFIARNSQRYRKNMFTEKRSGAEIVRKRVSRGGQYAQLCSQLMTRTVGDVCKETAVLYRNNDSAVPIIHNFVKQNIPYRCKGMDSSFFTSPSVQFLKDVFRFAQNSADCELFLKIYWKMGCYIKKSDAWQAVYMCRNGHTDEPLDALLAMEHISKRNREQLLEVKRKLRAIAVRPALENAEHFHEAFDYYKKDGEKYFILSQLADKGQNSQEFLDSLDRLQLIIEEGSNSKDASVVLSTIHSSKGLEYDRVILIDAIDGVLPSTSDRGKSFASSGEEEERRLFYVGATRAKKELIFYEYVGEKSPFIDQFMKTEPKVMMQNEKSSYEPLKYMKKNRHITDSPKHSVGSGKISMTAWSIGMEVVHSKFGYGRIMAVDERMVTIDFNEFGQKKFIRHMVEGSLRKV